MKKNYAVLLSLCCCITAATGCRTFSSHVSGAKSASSTESTVITKNNDSQTSDSLPDNILDSYYSAQSTPVFEYFQHNKIQKFLAMWVDAATGDMDNANWKFDNFTDYKIMNHKMEPVRSDQQLYCCTFSNGVDRNGYIVFAYEESGPSIQNYGVTETTPYIYDLKTNDAAILKSLEETDLDITTAKACRLSWFDDENIRSDQAVLFTDAKGSNYLCEFGDTEFHCWSLN